MHLSETTLTKDAIECRTQFDFVRYANCWEDADILVEALRGGPGKRILSIASAGDNSLALLATGSDVVAADLNASQLACLEIRCVAFRSLDYETLLAFMGVTRCNDRKRIYGQLQTGLSNSARAFWDAREHELATGIIHHGKFERYFQMFRTKVLSLIHSQKNILRLLDSKNESERIQFWRVTWNNWRWRTLLKIFFSRFVMGRLGRDPEFFRYVEGSIADQIQQRTEYALTRLPTDTNPYLRYIATGNFSYESALPRYLRREHFEAIRQGLDRLTMFHGPIEQAAAIYGGPGFDGFNLSDIFEYVSDEFAAQLYESLLSHANVGARLAYWNTFVPRRCPIRFKNAVMSLEQPSAEWFNRDRAFFYNHFQVDEMIAAVPATVQYESH